MKFSAIVALAATTAHAQYTDPYTSALDSRGRLCQASYEDAALDPLRPKLPWLSGHEITLEAMAEQTKPNAEERAALLAYDKLIANCDAGIKGILTTYRPRAFAAAHQQYADERQALRAKLFGGGMTFGDYVAAARAAQSRFTERMDQLDGQFAAQQDNAEAAAAQLEAARRAAMGNAVSNALRRNRPTTCRPDGLGGVICQ